MDHSVHSHVIRLHMIRFTNLITNNYRLLEHCKLRINLGACVIKELINGRSSWSWQQSVDLATSPSVKM